MKHALSLAVLALLFVAKTAAADGADDDDGFVAGQQKTETQTETEAVTPIPIPIPSPSPSPSPNPIPSPSPNPIPSPSPSPNPTPRPTSRSALTSTSIRDEGGSGDPHRGMLGPARLGVLAGVGAPSLFAGEVIAKIGDYIGIAGDYGIAPKLSLPLGGGAVSIQQTTITGSARIYPFRGAFFIGAGGGAQTTNATASAAVHDATPTSSFTTSVLFVEPELGVLWRSSSGISFGCDVGLEFPLTAHRSNSANLPASMDSAMKYAEKGPIPSVNLLRIGYVL